MSKSEDLRIVKTRLAIKKAFFELMAEKSFDKITVSDITDKALINRGTFYAHYKDKFDLLEQIEDETIEDMGDFIALLTEDSLNKALYHHRPLPHIIPILSYIEEHAGFFTLFANNDLSSLFYTKIVDRYFDQIMKSIHLSDDDKWFPYRKTLLISMVTGILNRWISTGMAETKEELAAWITEIVSASWSAFKAMK